MHPLCRVCWRCDGFQPSPLRLLVCRICFHEKALHGSRRLDQPLSEYEAVRKIQCLYRAKKARRIIQQARERRVQRVYSIKHRDFFYYNLWTNRASWDLPDRIPEDLELPIRDPDEDPVIPVPYTRQEASIIIQTKVRQWMARRICRGKLLTLYEKHMDMQTQQLYYTLRGRKNAVKLLEVPRLLRRLYDLGEPIEIQRLKRYESWTKDDAATVIQRRYRCRLERKRLKAKVLARYKKFFDAASGQYYYYNTITKESSWEKPKLLNEHEDIGQKVSRVKRKPRKHKFETEDAAARTIQALCRRYQSRKKFRQLLAQRYRKHLDPNTGTVYYYDRLTGTATWIKPLVLGDIDLPITELPTAAGASPPRGLAMFSPRRRPKSEESMQTKAMRKRERRHLQRIRKQMTREKAAIHLQRFWRQVLARRELKQMMTDAYVKILDPTIKQYYYYNKQTGQVTWEPPMLLDASDIQEAKIQMRRREHTITDRQEAACVVFEFFRCAHARLELHRLLRDRIQKVFDPSCGRYYYFDRITGQSAWKKPQVLKSNDLEPTKLH